MKAREKLVASNIRQVQGNTSLVNYVLKENLTSKDI